MTFRCYKVQIWDQTIADSGELQRFLGFEIKRDWSTWTISINQHSYIERMVKNFWLTNAKWVSMPMDPGITFSKDQSPSTLTQEFWMQDVPYAQAIGCVLWPIVISCLDALFAVRILSQSIQNPGPAHWEGVKRITTYLGNMKNLWLTFSRHGNTTLDGFCDADWAGQPHRHLISGYSFHMGMGAITWSSKKQYIVMLSSTEAEYIMQTHAVKEVMYLHTFVQEIHVLDKLITINCNSQGAIM